MLSQESDCLGSRLSGDRTMQMRHRACLDQVARASRRYRARHSCEPWDRSRSARRSASHGSARVLHGARASEVSARVPYGARASEGTARVPHDAWCEPRGARVPHGARASHGRARVQHSVRASSGSRPPCASGRRRSGAHARRAPRAGAVTARNALSMRRRRAGGARAQAARRASPRPRPERHRPISRLRVPKNLT